MKNLINRLLPDIYVRYNHNFLFKKLVFFNNGIGNESKNKYISFKIPNRAKVFNNFKSVNKETIN